MDFIDQKGKEKKRGLSVRDGGTMKQCKVVRLFLIWSWHIYLGMAFRINRNIDDVDKTMDEINEQTENMKQIQEALATPIGAAADFDEVRNLSLPSSFKVLLKCINDIFVLTPHFFHHIIRSSYEAHTSRRKYFNCDALAFKTEINLILGD